MRFHGTDLECSEIVAQLNVAHGYPRGYTQADVDNGLVRFVGNGPHAPLASLRTESIADLQYAKTDEDGKPVGSDRLVSLPELTDENRIRVARARVLRLLNRGTKTALMAIPGIGGTRADAIIAKRTVIGRWTSIEDVRDTLPTNTLQAIRDYALTKVHDEDTDEDVVSTKRQG